MREIGDPAGGDELPGSRKVGLWLIAIRYQLWVEGSALASEDAQNLKLIAGSWPQIARIELKFDSLLN